MFIKMNDMIDSWEFKIHGGNINCQGCKNLIKEIKGLYERPNYLDEENDNNYKLYRYYKSWNDGGERPCDCMEK
jgi:hypothetical protein